MKQFAGPGPMLTVVVQLLKAAHYRVVHRAVHEQPRSG